MHFKYYDTITADFWVLCLCFILTTSTEAMQDYIVSEYKAIKIIHSFIIKEQLRSHWWILPPT